MLLRTASILAASLTMAGCATMGTADSAPLATAYLINQAGNSVGTAELIERGTAHALRLRVTGMPAGAHGFHLHTAGVCATPSFESAGGHLNPSGQQHGSLNPQGMHLGDLPNINVPANGQLSTEVMLNGSRDELVRQLFDADGTAVMIHAQPDDYRSDPTGGAGARIACGVLNRV